MKIGSIVIDCNEFDKMLAFWQKALHYVLRKPAKGGWVVRALKKVCAPGPLNLAFLPLSVPIKSK